MRTTRLISSKARLVADAPPVTLARLFNLATFSALMLTTIALVGCEASDPGSVRGPVSREGELVTRAEGFLQQGMLDSALAQFGLALEENPSYVDAHLGMGEVYRQLGNYEFMARVHARVVRLEPDNFEGNYGLGFARQMLGNPQGAISAYLRALLIQPGNFDANRDIASAYIQLGQPDRAVSYAERAIEIDPESQGAWSNLGFAYGRLGRYEEAIEAYREAAELGEMTAPILLGLGDSHVKLGNYQQAEFTLRRLVQIESTAAAHERLGVALFRQNRYDEALEQFGLALIRDPEDVASLNGTGACLMTQYIRGNRDDHPLREQALNHWRRSLVINRDQPKISELIAQFSRM